MTLRQSQVVQDLLRHLTSAYMKCVYGWAGVHYVITKFSRMDSLQILLPMVLRCARFARESPAIILPSINRTMLQARDNSGKKNHVLKFETLNLFQNNRVNSLSLLFCHRDGH